MGEKRVINYVISGGKVTDWGECSKEEKEKIAEMILSQVEEALKAVWREGEESEKTI